MRLEAGFVASLRQELNEQSNVLKARTNNSRGMPNETLIRAVARPSELNIGDVLNAERHEIPELDDSHIDVGAKAIEDGHVAFCITGLNLLDKFSSGLAVLGLHLLQREERSPIIVMIDPKTKNDVIDYVNTLALPYTIGAFEQFENYALTPDNRLSFLNNKPELVTCGTGDFAPAMIESNVTSALKQSGVKHVVVYDATNACSPVSSGFIGRHIVTDPGITFQVTENLEDDDRAVVVWADGSLQAVERSRLPQDFDPKSVTFQTTGTFIIDVDHIEAVGVCTQWRWYRTRSINDGRIITTYERHIEQLTEFYNAKFVKVKRERNFMPLRTEDEKTAVESLFFPRW